MVICQFIFCLLVLTITVPASRNCCRVIANDLEHTGKAGVITCHIDAEINKNCPAIPQSFNHTNNYCFLPAFSINCGMWNKIQIAECPQ